MDELSLIIERAKGHTPERIVPVRGKESAVLIPIVPGPDGSCSVLFEVRGAGIGQPGEVCFPGGRVERGERPQETAVRETCEELLLDPSQVQIVAPMHVMTAFAGAEVYSFLGILQGYTEDDIGRYSGDEVDHVFTVPLQWFRDHQPRIHDSFMVVDPGEGFPYELIPHGEKYHWHKIPRRFYFYETDDAVIWGMTAELLYHFLQLICDPAGRCGEDHCTGKGEAGAQKM